MQSNGNIKTQEIDESIYEKIFIGIDPGINGGVAVINEASDDQPIITFRCPKNPRDMAFSLISTIPTDISYSNILTLVEHVHAMPRQGVVSTFTFGQNLGHWEGILGSFELNVEYLSLIHI